MIIAIELQSIHSAPITLKNKNNRYFTLNPNLAVWRCFTLNPNLAVWRLEPQCGSVAMGIGSEKYQQKRLERERKKAEKRKQLRKERRAYNKKNWHKRHENPVIMVGGASVVARKGNMSVQ